MSQDTPLSASAHVPGDGKGRILQAAMRLFAARGFNAVSISDVAEAAHVVKSAIYHYYTSKDSLYLAVLDETCRQSREQMEAGAQGSTWHERLRGAAMVLCKLVGPRSHVLSLILEGMAQASETNPADPAARGALRREFTRVLAREIDAGVAAGDLKPVDPELASICLIGMIAAALQASEPRRANTTLETDIEFALDLFLNGSRSSSQVPLVIPSQSAGQAGSLVPPKTAGPAASQKRSGSAPPLKNAGSSTPQKGAGSATRHTPKSKAGRSTG